MSRDANSADGPPTNGPPTKGPAGLHDPVFAGIARITRSLRKNAGMNRKDLAARSGLSERFLADIETGKANPSLMSLLDLCAALHCRVDGLLRAAVDGGLPTIRRTSVRRPVVALLGLRGAGKSTVGPILAERLQCPFVELDSLVEDDVGLPLADLFALQGEDRYRAAELRVLDRLARSERPAVVATGGGIVTHEAARQMLADATTTVWLRARPEEHWQRVVAQGDTRPMRNRDRAFEELRQILREREELYEQADLIVDTSGRGPHAVASAIADRLLALAAG